MLSGRWWIPYGRLMYMHQAFLINVPTTQGYYYMHATTLYLDIYQLVGEDCNLMQFIFV